MKNTVLLLAVITFFAACTSSKNASTKSEDTSSKQETVISWSSSLAEAQEKAQQDGKLLFVDVSAEWCGYCKKMKSKIYPDGEIGTALNTSFIPVMLDGEKGEGVELVSKLGISGYPTQLILGTDGKVLKQNTGYLSKSALLSFIK